MVLDWYLLPRGGIYSPKEGLSLVLLFLFGALKFFVHLPDASTSVASLICDLVYFVLFVFCPPSTGV